MGKGFLVLHFIQIILFFSNVMYIYKEDIILRAATFLHVPVLHGYRNLLILSLRIEYFNNYALLNGGAL